MRFELAFTGKNTFIRLNFKLVVDLPSPKKDIDLCINKHI